MHVKCKVQLQQVHMVSNKHLTMIDGVNGDKYELSQTYNGVVQHIPHTLSCPQSFNVMRHG